MPVDLRTVNQRDTQKKVMQETDISQGRSLLSMSPRKLSLIGDSKYIDFQEEPLT